MDREAVADTEALNAVLAWAAYADSVDKLDFLKSFCLNLGLEEIGRLTRIKAHVTQRRDVRKRKWTGISWEDYKSARLGSEENQKTGKEVTAKLKPVVIPTAELKLDPIPLPKTATWWDNMKFVAMDVEKVAKYIRNDRRKVIGHIQKAAQVGIVDADYNTLLEKDIFHEPGSFNTHPKTVAISGINKFDLRFGEKFENVVKQVKDTFGSNTVITIAGQNDFESLDTDKKEGDSLYESTFDLQEFYRRPSKVDPYGTEPMSLRDIFFFHFKEDIQFKKPHSALEDAKNTMKIFLEGYIPWKIVHGNPLVRRNVENLDFSNVPYLKKYEEIGKYYCKPSREFKEKCPCAYCKKYDST